ncbi:MAG: type II toxin-antitoxin system death-on-curing family toxin [Candidatus Dormibacteraeota bacterium]|uniref:Type II toxin-antitoxin system death-on-curing family toxin n=1 Tax=Candidatus Aeolococcus gillhamiae TaxID=3127015 RepID=A0A934JWR8_9BACT|nr:type II toxin-antitoxin system death-on-curing family toxin [Candidatus Dormibacteraeota bacterium]
MTADEVIYLELDDVVRLYARIFGIDEKAAENELRDPAALEGALERPRQHATYRSADLASQASILAHGVAQSQSFVDGNKRTALIVMTTFLAINGWDVLLPDAELAQSIIAFAEGADPFDLAEVLRGSLSARD